MSRYCYKKDEKFKKRETYLLYKNDELYTNKIVIGDIENPIAFQIRHYHNRVCKIESSQNEKLYSFVDSFLNIIKDILPFDINMIKTKGYITNPLIKENYDEGFYKGIIELTISPVIYTDHPFSGHRVILKILTIIEKDGVEQPGMDILRLKAQMNRIEEKIDSFNDMIKTLIEINQEMKIN